jgi:hypothetical protein
LQFPDGRLPSKEIINQWLKMVDEFFVDKESNEELGMAANEANPKVPSKKDQSSVASNGIEKRE